MRREHGGRTRQLERRHPPVLECVRVLDGMHPLDAAHSPELVLVLVLAAPAPLLREAALEPREAIRPGAALVRLGGIRAGAKAREGDVTPACDGRGACDRGDCEDQVHDWVQVQQQ